PSTPQIYTLSLHDALPICHPDTPIQARRNCATGYFANALTVFKNCVMRARRRPFFLHAKRNELFARPTFFRSHQNVATDEIWFRQIDKEAESSFDWISFGRQVGTVERVTHLQTQCVTGAETTRFDPEQLTCFERRVPKFRGVA